MFMRFLVKQVKKITGRRKVSLGKLLDRDNRAKEKLILKVLIHRTKAEIAVISKNLPVDGGGTHRQEELLYPETRKKMQKLRQILRKEHGINTVLFDTLRSAAKQEEVFHQGKSIAAPFESLHQYGLAFHLLPLSKAGRAIWKADHPVYDTMMVVAESLGLTAGRRWQDSQHFSHNIITKKERDEDSVFILKAEMKKRNMFAPYENQFVQPNKRK